MKILQLLFAAFLLHSASAYAASDYAATRYPLVLVHGWGGFAQIGTMDYFYQIPADLRANGAVVFTPTVTPVNSTEVRGEQLRAQVETILAITGAAKVNLVGHSQGGPTVRYVAGVMPDQVASVTAIAGNNKGTPVADVALALNNFGLTQPLVTGLLSAVAPLLGLATGVSFTPDVKATLASLSTPGMASFNQRFPDGVPTSACGEGSYEAHGQKLYSWTGTSIATNLLDPADYLMMATSVAFLGAPNDGMVGKCSAHFGRVLRDDYAWNHFDEVNALLGIRGLFSPDPVSVFRVHANRLKLAGL